jgi:hypothetical protein
MKRCYVAKEERYIVQITRIGKVNWICHILPGNCILKHVVEGKIEGKIEVTGRRRRRFKQLLNELK